MFDMVVNTPPYASICLENDWNVNGTAFDKYLDAFVINLPFISVLCILGRLHVFSTQTLSFESIEMPSLFLRFDIPFLNMLSLLLFGIALYMLLPLFSIKLSSLSNRVQIIVALLFALSIDGKKDPF